MLPAGGGWGFSTWGAGHSLLSPAALQGMGEDLDLLGLQRIGGGSDEADRRHTLRLGFANQCMSYF